MRKLVLWSLCVAAGSTMALWASDWPSTGGNPQRDGWSQGDTIWSKSTINKVKLLYKYKYDNRSVGMNSMTAPVVLSRLIGYHGFEELVMTTGSAGAAYATDADLGLPYFKTTFKPVDSTPAPASTLLCPGGQTAAMVFPGQSAVGRFGGGGGFRALGQYHSISADGYVRTLRGQDGQDQMIPPAKLLPPNSNIAAPNFVQATSTLYAATINGCGGPNALYAGIFTPPVLPPVPDQPMVKPASWQVTSFMTNGSGFAGSASVAAATNGQTVYGTVPDGKGDVAGTYGDTTLALDGKSLTVKDWFSPANAAPAAKAGTPLTGITPAVFAHDGKDYVLAGDRNGRIYVLDSTALGGSDHHTPLAASDPLVSGATAGDGRGLFGTFATMVQDGQRYVFAAVRGPVNGTFPGANGAAATGGIVAFKVNFTGSKPSLVPAWTSRDLVAPMAPATANGMVFALSSGQPTRLTRANGDLMTATEAIKAAKPATLYILDAATGKEMYTSGPAATTFSSTGIAVANGHVYFTTHDNTLFAFGVPEER